MKIIISGATGFVGSHLVRHFSSKGFDVLALGRQKNPPKKLLAYAKWKQVNLLGQIEILEGDVMIHAAGLASDKGSYEAYFQNNTLATQNIYKAFKGKHFIQISSSSIYGLQQAPLKETDAKKDEGISLYGQTKLLAEEILRNDQNDQHKITILRPRAIYGTHDRVLLPKILNLYKKNKIIVPGKMDIAISMTHISNLILAVEQAIKNQKDQYAIYNVSDDKIYNLKEIVFELILKIVDKNATFRFLPITPFYVISRIINGLKIPFPVTKQTLDYLSKSCVLDISKIKTELNYIPQSHFNNQLDNIKEWVNKVGLNSILEGEKKLPWMSV